MMRSSSGECWAQKSSQKTSWERSEKKASLTSQKFKLNFAIFLGENDLNSEKGGIYESPPDRYVPNSSRAKKRFLFRKAVFPRGSVF